tara:strand:+ start:1010 stop:1297 length:288 start_codon:yes stop_codon:yes gene_type:complete
LSIRQNGRLLIAQKESGNYKMKKTPKEIIQILATKYNLPLSKVEEIVMHQYKYVAKIMEKGDFEQVRLPYFGKFSSNPKRRDYITKLKNGSDNDR